MSNFEKCEHGLPKWGRCNQCMNEALEKLKKDYEKLIKDNDKVSIDIIT